MSNPYQAPESLAHSTSGTVITDVQIPFGRMVMIILKFVLASIPAMIIFYVIAALVMLLMAGLFGGGAAIFQSMGR